MLFLRLCGHCSLTDLTNVEFGTNQSADSGHRYGGNLSLFEQTSGLVLMWLEEKV